VPKHKLLVKDMQFCLIQQKDGARSSSQECTYRSSRRKRHASIVRDKEEEAKWKYPDVSLQLKERSSILA